MKALLTGATGFVGSTLCEELGKRGVEVRALVRGTSSLANLGAATFTTVKGSLSEVARLEEAVKGVDVIFHVAGVVAARNRAEFFAANAAGTRNLLEAAARFNPGLKRFVYVSSLAAAGPSSPTRPAIESDACAPVSDYGASKRAGEEAVLEYAGKFPVSIVRPPAVYGPRDKGVFTFFQAISRGILPLIGWKQPDSRRYSFVHVDDLVQGIAAAGLNAPAGSTGQIYYVSGDGEFSWEEAMRMMATGLARKTRTVCLPLSVMQGAAAVSSAYGFAFRKVLPFSLDKMKEIAAPAWTCSAEKAKRELGYEPYWKLEAGLAQTARWYKENRWL